MRWDGVGWIHLLQRWAVNVYFYLTENTQLLDYKDQYAKTITENDNFVSYESRNIHVHKHIECEKYREFHVKYSGGKFGNHYALK